MERLAVLLAVALACCTPKKVDPTPRESDPMVLSNQSDPPPTEVKKTPAAAKLSADDQEKVKAHWLSLPTSQESCGDFDYFPRGGLKSFACHLDLPDNYGWLAKASGINIWSKGPHSNENLDLNNRKEFGHYNPKFVRFIVDNLIPAATDEAFRKKTQPTYDKYVRPLAKTFLVTYEKFDQNPRCLAREVERIETFLAGKGVPPGDYERFFYFMNPDFCNNPDGDYEYFSGRGFDGGYGGNVVKTCAAFWVRRHIDGTAEEFYEGLKKLMDAYEPHAPKGKTP